MIVELAVMVPVALVVALVALNLVGYVEACAAFDQAALEAIVAHGVISPLMTRYVCTLRYRTWPRFVRLPGVTFEAPVELTHERELVVDRYRPGVVV